MKNLITKILSVAFVSLFVCVLNYGQSGNPVSGDDQISEELLLSSKPKAPYTDIARKKNFDGTVVLKITFLANGEVGEIIDVTKRKRAKMIKYGLTARAVEAAKKIRFVPAKKGGVPVTVIRTVEYSFAIY